MPEWSKAGRLDDFTRLLSESWDVLVVGGGITGAGIALDAASRGLKTALIEKGDFASGTSSRTSKLIHGGLRYLRELQLKTTIESSREKSLLRRLAPHLVRDLPFALPLSGGALSRSLIGAGLSLYDLAAGARTHRRVEESGIRSLLPGIQPGSGGYVYRDGQADDCRLVLHVLKRAVTFGALALNYVTLCGLGGGVRVREERGEEGSVRAKVVVNATGVWCDDVRALERSSVSRVVHPSKGVHIVVPRDRVGNRCAAMLTSPMDRRVVFLIPWRERTIIGTTDSYYSGDLDRPVADGEDVRYLLDVVNASFPGLDLGRADIISTYAGLRPLLSGGFNPSKVSREHRIFQEGNLISVTGGKLTTYRRIAKEVVDRITSRPCRTSRIDLFACPPSDDPLVQAYGTEADVARSLGEVEYAIHYERAVHVTDILARRMRRILYAKDQGRAEAKKLATAPGEMARYERELELHA